MKVLQTKREIAVARSEIIEAGVSSLDSPAKAILKKLRLDQSISVGDFVKSWDVLQTIRFLVENVAKDQPVLDIGAFASEMVVALHLLGYENVHGIDLDPRLENMPFSDSIHYQVGNFMSTHFPDSSFDAITSISVIEHGYDGVSLFSEAGRLLKPGGYFIASFDYWRSKINTTGIKFFGMTWTIFCEEDIRRLLTTAGEHGLRLLGEADFAVNERPIHFGGKEYTFGWLVLQKDTTT